MPQGDVFAQIDQLFRHEPVVGEVNTFVLHRFLASDPAWAPAAKMLGNSIRDDSMITAIWAISLPKMRKSPIFKYPAPKKAPDAEALIKKMAEVENFSLLEAEENVQSLERLGLKERALAHYGIDATDRKSIK